MWAKRNESRALKSGRSAGHGRHRRRSRRAFGARQILIVVCGPVLLSAALVSSPTPASGSGSAGWLVVCTAVHSLRDDPIVHPRAPGESHLHDFFGNPSTNASSTYSSMISASSGCVLAADTAGYWAPAVYRNGVKVKPGGTGVREQIYYRNNNLASGTKVIPFPADMRILAGNSAAKSAAQNPMLGKEIYWGCSDNSVPGKPITPPTSCDTGIISLHIGFPNCWDGVLTHVNDTAHLAYPKSGVCPSGFPKALPRLIARWEYRVGTTTGRITLSSGATYTIHGDFWNTWHQSRLVSLVANCLNANVDCGKPTS